MSRLRVSQFTIDTYYEPSHGVGTFILPSFLHDLYGPYLRAPWPSTLAAPPARPPATYCIPICAPVPVLLLERYRLLLPELTLASPPPGLVRVVTPADADRATHLLKNRTPLPSEWKELREDCSYKATRAKAAAEESWDSAKDRVTSSLAWRLYEEINCVNCEYFT